MRRFLNRLLARRDRLLANRDFTNKIAAFPIARGIARRQSAELFDLCAGFVYSQILAACVQLNLFQILSDGPQSIPDIAARTNLPLASAERLLKAASALRLAEERDGGRFGLGMLGAAVIANPGIARMVEHHASLYDDLRDPVKLLRSSGQETALGGYWPYAKSGQPEQTSEEDVATYSALMSASQAMVSAEILAAHSFANTRCLLDVGGGEGAFLSAVAREYPDLRLTLFDLPAVAARAEDTFRQQGLGGRAQVFGGNFLTDAFPAGADTISLVRVLHDHDDDAVRKILRTARDGLPAGGTILIAEPMAGSGAAGRVGHAYFGFYLLAMGSGRARRAEEYRAFLTEAGFTDFRQKATRLPVVASVITASSPGQTVKTVNSN